MAEMECKRRNGHALQLWRRGHDPLQLRGMADAASACIPRTSRRQSSQNQDGSNRSYTEERESMNVGAGIAAKGMDGQGRPEGQPAAPDGVILRYGSFLGPL